MRALLSSTAVLSGATGATALLGLAQAGMLVRLLGLEGYGTLALLQTFAVMMWTLANPASWQPFIAHAHMLIAEDRRDRLGALIAICRWVDRLAALTSVATGLVVAWALAAWHGWPTHGSQAEMARLASAYLLLVACLQLSSLPTGYLRLHGKMGGMALNKLGWSFVATIGVAAAWRSGASFATCAWWLLLVRSAEFATLWAAATLLIRRANYSIRTGRLREFPGFERALASSYGQNLTFNVVENADVWVAGALLDPAAAGIVRLARQAAGVVNLFSQPLRQAIYPPLAALAAHGRHDRLRRLLRMTTLLTLAAGTVCMAGFVILGAPILAMWVGGGAPTLFRPTLAYLTGAVLSLLAVPLMSVCFAYHRHGTHQRLLNGLLAAFVTVLVPAAMIGGATGLGMAYAGFYLLYLLAGSRLIHAIFKETAP